MDLSGLSSNLPCTKPSTMDELTKELTNEFKTAAKSVAALYNSTNTMTTAVSSAASGPVHLSADDNAASSAKKEFANAAKSVTALYKLTNNALSLARHKGYIDCLDDLLEALTNDQDLENWVLAKRAEMLNSKTGNSLLLLLLLLQVQSQPQTVAGQPQTPASSSSNGTLLLPYYPETAAADFSIPLDYDFSMTLDISPHYHFRPSFAPPSVLYAGKLRLFKQKRERQLAKKLQKQHGVHAQSLEDIATSDEEEGVDEEKEEMKLLKRRKLDRDSKSEGY